MTKEEIQEVKDLVLRELPRVLEQDPNFVVFIEGILSEKFPRRDEFARLLDELGQFRSDVNTRFDKVEARLGGMDQRLGGMDQRLEGMDQRLEGMDQRLEGVDQRLEQMDQRFEQVDQRFEQVDQRFEQVDQRFEQVDRSLAEIRQDIAGLKDWMEINVGGFQRRAGRRLEDVVAGAFCYGLQRKDIRPEHVHLRRKFEDVEGIAFKAGKTKEIDIIALAEEILVFEVKSTADFDDIDDLADRTALVRHLFPGKKVHGVMVTLGAEPEHRNYCEKQGLNLIP
jgi:archaellum component FlaC